MLQPAHTGLYQLPRANRGHLFSALVQGRPLVAWNQPSAIIHGSPSTHTAIGAFYPGGPVVTHLSAQHWSCCRWYGPLLLVVFAHAGRCAEEAFYMDYLIIWYLCTATPECGMYFVTLMNKNCHETTARSALTGGDPGVDPPERGLLVPVVDSPSASAAPVRCHGLCLIRELAPGRTARPWQNGGLNPGLPETQLLQMFLHHTEGVPQPAPHSGQKGKLTLPPGAGVDLFRVWNESPSFAHGSLIPGCTGH